MCVCEGWGGVFGGGLAFPIGGYGGWEGCIKYIKLNHIKYKNLSEKWGRGWMGPPSCSI